MPNRYANLNPTVKIQDDFQKINAGFDLVQAEMDGKLPKAVTIINGGNLNTLDIGGWYGGNNLTNAPGGSTNYFLVEHLKFSPNNYTQFAINLQTGKSHVRTSFGAWSGWQDHINSGTVAQTLNGSLGLNGTTQQLQFKSAGVTKYHVEGLSGFFTIAETGVASRLTIDSSGHVSLTGVKIAMGAGSPEGVITANVGSLFLRTDGGASTTLYVKQSGTGNTGWAAK